MILPFPKARYSAVIDVLRDDEEFHEQAVIQFSTALRRFQKDPAFKEWMLARYDEGHQKYGELDLDGKDWNQQAAEEIVDFFAYLVFKKAQDSAVPIMMHGAGW